MRAAVKDRLWIFLLSASLFGCSDTGPTGVQSVDPVPRTAPAQPGADPHFYFLPPLVRMPTYGGVFDPNQRPTVTICLVVQDQCGTTLATYTTEGKAPTRVTMDLAGEYYQVNWPTRTTPAAEHSTTRIRVLIGAAVLGSLDLQIGSPTKGGPGWFAYGSTVPIKFRIEQGALSRWDPVSDLSSAEPVYHVNPGDGVFLSVHATDGDVVNFYGQRNEGLPSAVAGFRKFALGDISNFDEVRVGSNHLPTSISTRSGAQVFFDYLPDGVVRLTFIGSDGTIGTSFFNFTPGAATAGVRMPGASALQSLGAAGNVAPVTITPVNVKVSVNEDGGGGPVDDASVSGEWDELGTIEGEKFGQFPLVHSGSGLYEGAFGFQPTDPGILENLLGSGCEATSDALGAVCTAMSSVGTETFVTLASLACTRLINPIAVTACVAAVALTGIFCDYPICETISHFIDWFPTGRTQVLARATAAGSSASGSTSISPPFPGDVPISITLPNRGFTGHWTGSWSFADGSFGGPAAFTLLQNGSAISGTYDLFYSVIPVGGTGSSTSMSFSYRGFDPGTGLGSNNIITLTRGGGTISGSQTAFYDDGSTYTWNLQATRASGGTVPTGPNPLVAMSANGPEVRRPPLPVDQPSPK